jgi:hypothetical protein
MLDGGDVDLKAVKDEEALLARITQRFGYGALSELEKYRALLEQEERATTKRPAQSQMGIAGLKDELRRERAGGGRPRVG